LKDDREEPRRLLNRHEAVRRLIHTAVRMFASGEDPFAVHLLIQSADKLLVDIAKKRAVNLAVDWGSLIKDEHRQEFFAMYRETYNFFKHADKGPDHLSVYNITEANAAQLTIAVENYAILFGAVTSHMFVFRIFSRLWKPNWFLKKFEDFVPAEGAEEFAKSVATLREASPAEFFRIIAENRIGNAAFEQERATDLAETREFYSTAFENMESGRGTVGT
jgi:hypothetical protein